MPVTILTSRATKQLTILKQVWLTLCLLRSYLSSYVELNFPFTVKGVDLNATCGVLPYDAGVTTYGGDVNSGFAVTNVALKVMKDIKITNSFSLPIFTQAIWNPRMEDAHLVLGISLRP